MVKRLVSNMINKNRHLKMADSLYRVILQRRAELLEQGLTTVSFQFPGQFESRVSDMLHSEEFKIMALPGLVVGATHNWSGKRVFFLHVPKTAGTSVRLALIKSVGTPAFEFYNRIPSIAQSMRELENNFWPLWVGHQNVSSFPSDMNGLTIFRESRSRILSTYRHRGQMALMNNPHMLDSERLEKEKSQARTTISTPFGTWLPTSFRMKNLGYFIPPEEGTKYRSKEFESYINKISESGLEQILNESLSRFTHAAWSHDEPAILRAISEISGRETTELPRENVYPNLKGYPPQVLDSEAIAELNTIQDKEFILYKVAHEHGLVPLLSKSEADDLFEITAKRLGFTFG